MVAGKYAAFTDFYIFVMFVIRELKMPSHYHFDSKDILVVVIA